MTEGSSYQEAVATGMLPSEESHRALLQSIVDVARAIFAHRDAVAPGLVLRVAAG
jgi:hypothetical protein